jgi:heme A synthase
MTNPPAEPSLRSVALMLAALIAVAAAIGGLGLLGELGLTVVALPLGIGLHEVVHLVVGAAVGLEVRDLRVGSGPPLIQRTVRNVRVTVGSGFDSGVTTFADPLRRPKRWKMLLVYLAAPVANLAVALPLLRLPPRDYWNYPRGVLVALGIVNLVPFSHRGRDGRRRRSDMLNALRWCVLRSP